MQHSFTLCDREGLIKFFYALLVFVDKFIDAFRLLNPFRGLVLDAHLFASWFLVEVVFTGIWTRLFQAFVLNVDHNVVHSE